MLRQEVKVSFKKIISFALLLAATGAKAEQQCLNDQVVLFRDPAAHQVAAFSAAPKSKGASQVSDLGLGAYKVKLPSLGAFNAESEHISYSSALNLCNQVKDITSANNLKCEPDCLIQLDSTPNDPYLSNPGLSQKSYPGDQLTAINLINPTQAWDISTGQNQSDPIVVAVIDTGADYTHSDLAANIWTNSKEIPGNGIDDDGNGFIDDLHGYDFYNNDGDPRDDNGHGTHVSGTIGAVGNNSIGVAGMIWKVRIMPVKFLGAGGNGSTSGAISAISYAVSNGAKILNNSWGGGGYSQALQNAIKNANDKGVLVVAAAGNEKNDNDASPSYPASLTGVIAVAATDSSGNLASFSNYGANSVQIAAPGVNILSTWPNSYYAWNSGTSMASPHVAGAAALAWSINPNLTLAELTNLLLNTTTQLSALSGKVQGGGLLNLYALAAAARASNPNAPQAGDAPVSGDPELNPNPANSLSAYNASDNSSTVRAGSKIAIDLTTATAGNVKLKFSLDRFSCKGALQLKDLKAGQSYSLKSTLSNMANGFGLISISALSSAGSTIGSAGLSITSSKHASASRLKAQMACEKLIKSTHAH